MRAFTVVGYYKSGTIGLHAVCKKRILYRFILYAFCSFLLSKSLILIVTFRKPHPFGVLQFSEIYNYISLK